MKYYLNEFITIVKGIDEYVLFEKNISTKEFTEKQKSLFGSLFRHEGLEEEKLKLIFGIDTIEQWIRDDVLVNRCIDYSGIDSRNQAYFWNKGMTNAKEVLEKSSVLILGCGGLGTHIAWNMVVLGVGTIHLLDYDIVEESNLNRQILFDMDDIGKYKVDVLEEKLHKINPHVILIKHKKKIDSEETLEQVIKLCKPDCIAKALDLPVYITKWVDDVCEKLHVKYVTGIMLGTAQMIGPTYSSDNSLLYSDFFEADIEHDRFGGIAPSLGFVMYQMAGELSEEIFKVLTKKENLKYENNIVIHDNITDEVRILKNKNRDLKKNSDYYTIRNLINILMIIMIYYIGSCFQLDMAHLIVAGLVYILIVPVLMSQNEKEAFQFAFISLCTVICNNILLLVRMQQFGTVSISAIPNMISILLISMSVIALILYFFYTLIFFAKKVIRQRR